MRTSEIIFNDISNFINTLLIDEFKNIDFQYFVNAIYYVLCFY